MVTTVPWRAGDPSWVFPSGLDEPVRATLEDASRRLVDIAATLEGGRAGWAGEGLEFSLYPSGERRVGGFAENQQVSFVVDLGLTRDPRGATTWELDAEISVRCDHPVDCGMHQIETRRVSALATPAIAIRALDDATQWLLARARAVDPSEWRARDPR